MGTGIAGAGPLSLGCETPTDTVCAIDRASAAASALTSAVVPAGRSPTPSLGATAMSFTVAEWTSFSRLGTDPALARPRASPFADFPLVFTTFSLMARGTKPYLSVPEFVNIQ